MSTPIDQAPTALLDRVQIVLDTFEDAGPLTLSQVVQRTGLPRSSTHRILDQLVRLRWIQRSGHDYRLGLRLLELGVSAVRQDSLHAAAVPVMVELHRRTRAVVHLGILDGDEVIYLHRETGPWWGEISTRVGGRVPALNTAVGRVLLAARDGRAVGEGPGMPVAVAEKIRRAGVARMTDPTTGAVTTVAVPIGPADTATAALSLYLPARGGRLDPQVQTPLREAAGRIQHGLDAAGASTPPAGVGR